jgi:tetratricopeptide (TPR) repeat protein
MVLRAYGWEGDQRDISDLIKPRDEDRNVNVEELVYYVRNRVGWLNIVYRVGGNLELLKTFLASGLPVMIEEGMTLEEAYWPNDDHWAGHYLLLTAYDDPSQTFTAQDSFRGPNQSVPYAAVQKNWQAFNYVYILIYRADQAEMVRTLLDVHWDADANRQLALDLAISEAEAAPDNAFARFNVGSNLVYFERYAEAARAFDAARSLGLPQRMLRYQFSPFFAYFFSGRNADLLALTEYALKITPDSEETLLWRGWGLYRDGKKAEAVELFDKALRANPNYEDAKYALDFVKNN